MVDAGFFNTIHRRQTHCQTKCLTSFNDRRLLEKSATLWLWHHSLCFCWTLATRFEVKICQVAWTTNMKHPLIMCRRKKQNWDGSGTVALFCEQSLFTSAFSLFCRGPTWLSYRHQRAKLPSSWLERASKWKHWGNADFSASLQHRGICWISSRPAISFYLTRKSQRAVRAAVGPRRRGPAGLEWSWERTAKLLLPPSALRRARGSCHRPCGWGSEHKTHQATR